jgi:septum formation protein
MLVLASASPRRHELLRRAGIEFTVEPADIAEIPLASEAPRGFAERMAREKALTVFSRHPFDLVLGADTVVVIEGQILGKPRGHSDAARMLRLLSGRSHEVITGVCLTGPAKDARGSAQTFEDMRSETTLVMMGVLSEGDIRAYVATGEPMDKAGAYAIQGIASRWITRIEGDYCNVVGLPVAMVWKMLKQHS